MVQVVVLVLFGVAGLGEAFEGVDLGLHFSDVGQEHVVVCDFDALLRLSGLRLADFELRHVFVRTEVFDRNWNLVKVLPSLL